MSATFLDHPGGQGLLEEIAAQHTADNPTCGNGSIRTEHPCESQGEGGCKWGDWGLEIEPDPDPPASGKP